MQMDTWRNIFFFEGLFTVLVSFGAPFFMPTSPQDCWFLNERERMIATQRLLVKGEDHEATHVQGHHVRRAILNICSFFCALGFFCINITVQGISLFMVNISLMCYSEMSFY